MGSNQKKGPSLIILVILLVIIFVVGRRDGAHLPRSENFFGDQ